MMAVPVEEGVLSALRGVVTETTRLPKPLIIKVFLSSLKEEFKEERRMILELIGPELQSLYDDKQVEIELVDMHFGTGPDGTHMLELDPYLIEDYLFEVETCYKVSKSVFFIALLGESVGEMCLPTRLDEDIYVEISNKCSADDRQLLDKWFENSITPNFGEYCLKKDYRNQSSEEWLQDYVKLLHIIEESCQHLQKTLPPEEDTSKDIIERLKVIRMSEIEKEINRALDLSPEKMIAVFREWSDNPTSTVESREKLRQLKDRLTFTLPSENYTTLIVPRNPSNHQVLDPDFEDHELYLSKFKTKLLDKIRNSIEQNLAHDPDVIKGRKKTVQEIFHEHSTHLRFLAEHLSAKSLISSSIPDRLRTLVLQNYRSGSRHAPYFIQGDHGTGKSTLLAELYSVCPSWFDHGRVHRIIRYASATPRSAYNLELLRVVCQQISIIFNIPEGYLPKDASFDPLYINNWFQNLLKRCEDLNHDILFLFIDDLHKLNPIDCDIVAALSWLPISLPWNVYLICSTTLPTDQLKFTPIQKDRFRSTDSSFDLSLEANRTVLDCCNLRQQQQQNDGISFRDQIVKLFDELEKNYGSKGFGRLASYITCSEHGLTETELLELLMPTESSETMIDTQEGNFNFSTFRKIRYEMKLLIREKQMSGKILIEWRHRLCAEVAKERYLNAESKRAMHTEIANIFFNRETEESDVTTSELSQISDSQTLNMNNSSLSKKQEKRTSQTQDDSCTLYNPPGSDVSYSIRHVEESWHHLMRSEDTNKFKQIAVCNFDFLLAAVQTVSISYLRCLIEHVRSYILDRDIELIYYTIRKSSDVLTRDPMQLGAQLISWLRPINEHDKNDNSLLSITVRSATAWCDGYTVPLLVPLTGWLPVPLPSQIRTMTVSGTGPIRDIVLAPTKQHLIIAPKIGGDAQLWHIMSNSLVHTFKGHSEPVTCMMVPAGLELLITGSEDATCIVWDVNKRAIKTRISKGHSAAVLCVTCAMSNTLVISGGDDFSIIISSMETGKRLCKIDHHRAPVTSVKVSTASEVLVSSSLDGTICLWSLENYSLLNCIQMNKPIIRMEISSDSVFLLAYCEDNGLYLRTLATGTELHGLKGHKSKVRTISMAMDSQRAIVGCDDTRALIFDMHSGRLVRSLPPNPGPVTAVDVMDNDDFLITAGGNKITFYSFRNEEAFVNPYSHHRRKRSLKNLSSQRHLINASNIPPVTCFDISRDSQLAAVASSKSIHIMQINSPELQSTLDGHTGAVTCVSFSPNGEFVASGSEDKTVIVWGLTLGLVVNTFKGHNSAVHCVVVMMDSRRIMSADRDGFLYVWIADSATLLQTVQGPYKQLAVTNNMKFAVCTNGDNSLKIWSLTREDEKYTVSHSAEITCFIITADSLYIITGSRDMSLKVWQATGGKLAQVLVGHSDAVTCVAVSVTNKNQVISGSKDCNLIVWDIHTGEEMHTLAGHLASVTCVKVSADGTTAVSGSDDKTLIVWEIKRGLALTSLHLHVPFTCFDISLECSRILVQLIDSFNLPVICLHNTPASYVKLPTYSAPARDVEDLRPAGPKRQMKRLLKKEVSLDTYTWQKKYGHLTSSVMMAQVDERLKRRFSVSASMEEISKIAEMKTLASQASLGPEQAALAQSQHFDQLEALWNKRSPPRRRHNASLSRQSSLVEDRIESSDEDDFQEERTGMLRSISSTIAAISLNNNSTTTTDTSTYNSARLSHAEKLDSAWNRSCCSSSSNSSKFLLADFNHKSFVQPDLVQDVLTLNSLNLDVPNNRLRKFSPKFLRPISTENDLVHFKMLNNRKTKKKRNQDAHSDCLSNTTTTSGDSRSDDACLGYQNLAHCTGTQSTKCSKKKRKESTRSCIAQ